MKKDILIKEENTSNNKFTCKVTGCKEPNNPKQHFVKFKFNNEDRKYFFKQDETQDYHDLKDFFVNKKNKKDKNIKDIEKIIVKIMKNFSEERDKTFQSKEEYIDATYDGKTYGTNEDTVKELNKTISKISPDFTGFFRSGKTGKYYLFKRGKVQKIVISKPNFGQLYNEDNKSELAKAKKQFNLAINVIRDINFKDPSPFIKSLSEKQKEILYTPEKKHIFKVFKIHKLGQPDIGFGKGDSESNFGNLEIKGTPLYKDENNFQLWYNDEDQTPQYYEISSKEARINCEKDYNFYFDNISETIDDITVNIGYTLNYKDALDDNDILQTNVPGDQKQEEEEEDKTGSKTVKTGGKTVKTGGKTGKTKKKTRVKKPTVIKTKGKPNSITVIIPFPDGTSASIVYTKKDDPDIYEKYKKYL